MATLDSSDVAKSLAAQAHHLDDECRDGFLERIKEDFPEIYGEVKNRLASLEKPDSLPPDGGTGTGGMAESGRVGRALNNFQTFIQILKKNGVWAAVAILLIVCGYLTNELRDARQEIVNILIAEKYGRSEEIKRYQTLYNGAIVDPKLKK